MARIDDFDTNALSEQGVDLELMNPSGDPMFQDEEETKPVTIRLLGRDSEQFMKTQRRQIERRIQKDRGRRNRILTVDEVLDDQAELLAAVTVGWEGIETTAEGVIPFSKPKATEIYRNYPWIRDQVDSFVGDRANFMKKESNDSRNTPGSSSTSNGESREQAPA